MPATHVEEWGDNFLDEDGALGEEGDYVLAASSDDEGGRVPSLGCSHLKAAFPGNVKKIVEGGKSKLSGCQVCNKSSKKGKKAMLNQKSNGHELWICLTCGHVGCGRGTPEEHALQHSSDKEKHALAVSLDSLSCWCYRCDDDVDMSVVHDEDSPLEECMRLIRDAVGEDGRARSAPSGPLLLVQGSGTSAKASGKKKGAPTLSSVGTKGLSNLGNTCFFNSVMQCLLQTKELRLHFGSDEYDDVGEGALTCELRSLVTDVWSVKSEKLKVITPGGLFGTIQRKAPRFKGYSQQDSQELLHYLLDVCRTEEQKKMKTKKMKTFVDNIFGVEVASTVRCHRCEKDSVTTSSELDLSLQIPRMFLTAGEKMRAPAPTPKKAKPLSAAKRKKLARDAARKKALEGSDDEVGEDKDDDGPAGDNESSTVVELTEQMSLDDGNDVEPPRVRSKTLDSFSTASLEACMFAYTEPELLTGSNGFKCENCCKSEDIETTNAFKQLLLAQGSLPPVIVFHFKRFLQTARRVVKISQRVNFPDTINLEEYLDEPKVVQYRLFGVVVHGGGTGGGHYTSYTRKLDEEDPSMRGDTWVWFSDTKYRMASFDEVMKSEAYLLFYERER